MEGTPPDPQHVEAQTQPTTPAKSTMPAPAPSAQSPTDSPWLWLAIFIVGGLIALYLTMPKYAWRQPQIERQFQARERSGQAVSAHGGYSPLSTTNHTLLTLRPLIVFFTLALLTLTVVFWWRRLLRPARLSAPATASRENAANSGKGDACP